MSTINLTPTFPTRKDLYKRFKVISEGIWTILLPELASFDSICSIALCAFCSYYIYKFGFWLGAQSCSLQMASIFSDKKVLHGSFYPREVRLYAQALLCLSIGTLLWSVSLGLKTLEYQNTTLDTSAVSPKLPFSTPSKSSSYKFTPLTASFVSLSPRQPPSAIRAACISRIKKFIVLLFFCIAFLRRQKVSPTLVYHPVNSPFLLPDSAVEENEALDIGDQLELNTKLADLVESGSSPLRYNDTVVPSIIHFVFGLDETFGDKPFNFPHYLSMYSAMVESKPEKVMFWYNYLPSEPESPNWWWDRILRDAEGLKVQVELKKARQFDSIFGRPISKFAHKADIIRLEALLEYGGIYLDLDVYTIRSFEPLRHFDTVLGLEGGVPGLEVHGLCNGVIISTPNSPFLKRWYESYRTFNGNVWAKHSVAKPLQLALKNPSELLVLDPYSLFYPAWNEHGLLIVHSRGAEILNEGWDFKDSHQFAYHAWSTLSHKRWLSKLTPDKVFAVETSFNLLMRQWTSESLREDWKVAKQQGLVA